MAFSNSFHSSAKSHSIGSASKLGSVEAHNERDFVSSRFNAEKTQLIQGELGLAANVQAAINDIFRESLEEYNRKQKRKSRQITETPFEHFCNNSKLDIAAEAIYQIGDQDFWARWRTDTVTQRGGKEVVRCDYPPEVVEVMSAIYRRQMDAYEKIYETHGRKILAKIELHYARCQDILDHFRKDPETYAKFEKIAETSAKPRKALISKLSEKEREAYHEFQEAYHSARDIEKRKYQERIQKGQMHIRNIQGMAHFDESSPHAHGVSICWTDGYKTGLSSRVAKAVVLNRYALEVIQDRLHEIALEEITKHPEIFQDEELKEKGKGRNMDYTTEQIVRHKQAQLQEQNAAAERKAAALQVELGAAEAKLAEAEKDALFHHDLAVIEIGRAQEAQTRAAEATKKADAEADRAKQNALEADAAAARTKAERSRYESLHRTNEANMEIFEHNAALIQEQHETLNLIQSYEQYNQEALDLENQMDLVEETTHELPQAAVLFRRQEAHTWLQRMKDLLWGIRRLIDVGIQRLRIFERIYGVPDDEQLSRPAQTRALSLDNKLKNAFSQIDPLTEPAGREEEYLK